MRKSYWIFIIIILVLLILFGIFTTSKACNSFRCEYRIFGILYKTIESPPIVGGCAGVYKDNQPQCCENWARENGIVHAACVGNWTVEDNKCTWKCESGERVCDRDEECMIVCAACISTEVCSCPVSECINQTCKEVYMDTVYPNGTHVHIPIE